MAWRSGPLSLAYLTVEGADPVQHIEAASTAGFAAAGLRIQSPSHVSGDQAVVGNSARVRDIKRALAATGVRAMDAEVATLSPGIEPQAYRPMVETAAELGFQFIQVVGEDSDLDRATDRLAAFAELAATFRLRLAIEFMRFRSVGTLDAAVAMIERANKPNICLLLDALHLARSGGNPAAIAELPASLVAVAQLCDGPVLAPPLEELAKEARTDRLYPGEGALPLAAFLDALPSDIPLSIEVPHRSHSRLSAKERALNTAAATRRFLDTYLSRDITYKSPTQSS
jgi:sugar phosphate isomerase/epimerase